MKKTKEPQYDICLQLLEQKGLTPLGLMSNQVWLQDPKRLTFLLSRYKFAAKMLAGSGRVLEVGCGDGFATRIVAQEVDSLTAVDFDPVFVEDCRARMDKESPFECCVNDLCEAPMPERYDAAYTLDVLEHIDPKNEDDFIGNIHASLTAKGVLIVGTPTLESQEYASPPSKAGHVNCKTEPQLRALLARYFNNVFIFSMNDEVVHTGFYPMAHYLLALCCFPRENRANEESA